jgi:tetratricopeptide (TPR) repeat protein
MARSFYRPRPENTIEDYTGKNTYFHQPSDTYFVMTVRAGRYYQRQYQLDQAGKQTNSTEKEIDFVLGSGDHVRSYVHRNPNNTLVELPVAWYAEKGGYWTMNPGYDRPDHLGFRRSIAYDCMFCHNAYPDIPAGSNNPRAPAIFTTLPEGIDCQRCHGGGEKHMALAGRPGSKIEEIRHAIVNPVHLTPERQMEVCLQCHLQTTSSPLPGSMVRYERQPFSYRPGEPLADFMLHFDHAPGTGHDDKFEITSSPYRLRRSKCFQKSAVGALSCITCHDPHGAIRDYTAVCRQCHGTSFERLVSARKHTESADCVGCHMPKRRAGDVVHAVMTDHNIQRNKPPGNALAEIAEPVQNEANAYRGEVVLYYPPALPSQSDELYLAIAQVAQSSNLYGGIERLKGALEKYRPAHSEYYLQLADAFSNGGKPADAIPWYEEAVRHEPKSAAAFERMAISLVALRQFSQAEKSLKHALELTPEAAGTWVWLGAAALQQGKTGDALAAFQRAIQVDPEMVEAYNSAGAVWLETGDAERAEAALRAAMRIQPNYAPARNNLGNLLSSAGKFEDARYQFEAALRLKENYNGARYNYALALMRVHRVDEAQTQVEAILRTDSRSAEAHEFLGNLLAAKGQLDEAKEQYRAAILIEPEFARANLDLGTLLVNSGDMVSAVAYLRKAASGQDEAARDSARKLLEKLRKNP